MFTALKFLVDDSYHDLTIADRREHSLNSNGYI